MSIEEALRKAVRSGWIQSPDQDLEGLIQGLDPAVQKYVVTLVERVQTLSEIGTALSAEHDLQRLLETIVSETRNLTRADGGTLYLAGEEKQRLHFEIIQTASLNLAMGGATGEAISWEPIPLYGDESHPNHNNVSTYVALTGNVVNIPDVYDVEGFDFSGTKQFDASNGYRSRSMLVIPMQNYEDEIIGALQLINAIDEETGEVIGFTPQSQKLAGALASQAAIAITNATLIRDLRNLFDSLIQVIATAVDEKSPYTGGHIHRVAELSMRIAGEVNADQEGEFAEITFTEEELEELRIAAWLHDIGKITTPEYIVDKATKLETIYDRIHAVNLRYEIIRRDWEIDRLRARIERLESGAATGRSTESEESPQDVGQLDEERYWLHRANFGRETISEQQKEKIRSIAARTYFMNGEKRHLLEPDEVVNLKVSRGTLNEEERAIIMNHVNVTRRLLDQLPFPGHLSRVPEFAGGHHEKLDGSGYPEGKAGEEIPLQTRIMAFADVFEALTAEDRPYKPGKQLSEAMQVLQSMVKNNEVDGRIFRLFVRSGLVKECAEKYIKPEQVDCVEYSDTGEPLTGK